MNTLYRTLLGSLLLLVAVALPALAQDSTRHTPPDSVTNIGLGSDSIVMKKNGKVITIESYAAQYDPKRAIMLAAAVPGLGQIYNKKYWKVPLVFGGFAGLGYAVWWNQDRYLFYRKALFNLLNEPANPVVNPATGLTKYGNKVFGGTLYYPVGANGAVTKEVARNAVTKYRRDRDYMLIMTFIFYMMQMVDAHVDAHLKEFDLNPQLKVSIEPVINQNAFTGRTSGVGFTLKF